MFTPQFLITPYEVKVCHGLRPTDGDVYAVIYWFQNLKDGKCTAANATIAEILQIDDRTVRAALDRLEKKGFIERVYEDPDTKKIRKEIRSLVMFAKVPGSNPIHVAKKGKVKKQDFTPGGIVPVESDVAEQKEETPGQYAKRFFDKEDRDARSQLVDEIIGQNPNINRDELIAEIKKFFIYWTEPNKSGTKVKWQMERTFEVKRRLATWLSRSSRYAGMSMGAKRSGAGVTV